MSSQTQHKRFTVAHTSYIENLTTKERKKGHLAIFHEAPPKHYEDGRVGLSLNFPVFLVTSYLGNAGAVSDRVARILNECWDDPRFDATEGAA